MTGISCVCPTTASRWWCLPLAIECWQRQTHDERELVVVVDGDPFVPADPTDPHGTQEHISNLVPLDDDRVRYIYLQGERTLGEKYDACLEAAGYDWVALWADDDWHAPTRLEATAKLINDDIDVVGDWTFLMHVLNDKLRFTGLYQLQRVTDPPSYIISGTMCVRRELALNIGFPAKARGSDDVFVHKLLVQHRARLARLRQPPYLYVVFAHGENVSNRIRSEDAARDPCWRPWPGDLNELMGGDLVAYEAAYLLRQ